ncbi:MAG: UDP-2 3-diacylglucosamine hydrolase [Rhodocyclaceae bacterium]|nr:MAG: UDP-2 3-diacylglucosamine hydrolase [Rhodocyclaceae bacterium]TND01645.1 MAG: UDP-2,3-diacylglucosamine hydrolase [Rhodocyclaceae bacterium]
MLTIAGTARFVSDLHLRAERPDLTQRFADFLAATAAARVETLFILGDLFEYWIGDDDLGDPFNARVCKLLRDLADRGTRIFFIAGNRDFLIGETFAAAAGMRLLSETEKVGAGGTPTLLMHGDTVCIDDLPYQEFRRMVRSQQWQADFLARPLPERRAEVASLRRRSAEAMQGKTAAIMDANGAAIREALTAHGCTRLIHGHTHRPGHEVIQLASGSAERWVLSDWDTGRGDALEIDAAGIRRINLST